MTIAKFNSFIGNCPKHGKSVFELRSGKCSMCEPSEKKGLYYSSDVAADKVRCRHAIEDHQERRTLRVSENTGNPKV